MTVPPDHVDHSADLSFISTKKQKARSFPLSLKEIERAFSILLSVCFKRLLNVF